MQQDIQLIVAGHGLLTRVVGVFILLQTLVQIGLALSMVEGVSGLVLLGNGGVGFALELTAPLKEVLKRNRSGCDNRNHAAACDFCSLAGSREGAASPRKAASHAVVRYSKTLRCCCFNVATTVIMLSTKREPSALCVPKLPLRQSTPGRIALSAVLFVGSTPATCTFVQNA